jgi:hypothetical protein
LSGLVKIDLQRRQEASSRQETSQSGDHHHRRYHQEVKNAEFPFPQIKQDQEWKKKNRLKLKGKRSSVCDKSRRILSAYQKPKA